MTGETPAARMTIYLDALRRHWRLAASIVIACVLGGVAVAIVTERAYDATAKVLVGQRSQLDALLGASDYSPDPERDLNTSIALITIEPVAERVSRRLDLNMPPAALASKVSADPQGNSNVVAITVRDASAARAARIANAFAHVYRDFHAEAVQAAIDDAIEAARRRAEGSPPGPARAALDDARREVEAAAAFRGGGVQIVRRASAGAATPAGGIRPAVLLAGFLGVALASVAVVVLARSDKRLRRDADVEAVTGRPVLAALTRSARPRAAHEARDALAQVGVRLTLGGLEPGYVLVTSPRPGEGAAEVTLGLAAALGELGRRVIAIEADLREPCFERLLGIEAGNGLSDALTGRCALEDAMVVLALASRGGEVVSVVPAGDAVETPQALLAGPRMSGLLAHAADLADVVLVAGGPATAPGDSLTLVPHADVVIVTVRLDVTRRDDLARAVAALDELDARVLGTVTTAGAPPRTRVGRPLSRQAQPAAQGASTNGFHRDVQGSTEVMK